VLQRWYEHNGYKGGGSKNQGKKKKLSSDLANMSDQQITALFTRFFEWWVVDGRPGDTVKGGKQVRMSNQYGRTPATSMFAGNSAIQQYNSSSHCSCVLAPHMSAGIAACVSSYYHWPQSALTSVDYCMLMAAGASRAVRPFCCYEGTLRTAGLSQPPAPQCRPQQLSASPDVILPLTVPGVVQQEA
jgi:hypothetical protein